MISVIIPLYNKERQISKTIESVLGQSYKNFEIIIVNDGSTDNSVDVVKRFTDTRIRLIEQANAGVAAARNRGISEAKGEFLAFLDADDEWLPNYLKKHMNLVREYPECDVFANNYIFCDAKGYRTSTLLHRLPFDGAEGVLTNYFEVASCSHPPMWTSAILVRKNAMDAIGGFPIGITNGEDLLTWARLAVKYKIAFNKEAAAIYNLKAGHGVNSKPVNIPQGNAVGIELEKLLPMYNGDKKGLAKYIGRWYKIRSSLFLRGGERKNALINIIKAIKFQPEEWKLYFYLIMLVLPNGWVNYLFKKI